jgi:hypothetical protein
MRHRTHTLTALAAAATLGLLAACGGGSSSGTLVPFKPYVPGDQVSSCVPGKDVTGAWKTVANNQTLIPDSLSLAFFSYNQPSVNRYGMVVFRGRAREPVGSSSAAAGSSGSPGSTGMTRGVFAVDICVAKPPMYTVGDTNMLVPDPNNTQAQFNEFPSIPRIDIDTAVIATRGQSDPVWTLADGTKLGTTGVYVTMTRALSTAVNLLGAVPDFSYMQVPGATTPATRFDQFPGSPSVTQGRYVVFKGNYTDGTTGSTGVYYRDMNTPNAPVQLIANTMTPIPGASGTFGSTAPPSAAGGKVVFVGLDNENAPTAGGLYLANVAPSPALNTLVKIGDAVPDGNGVPLPAPNASAPAPTFTQIGEGLGYDGRYVSFWGAWDTQNPQDPAQVRTITRSCPSDGNKDLLNYCQSQYKSTNGVASLQEPVNQGIFVYDTASSKLWMAARAGTGTTGQFQDLLFWTYSGKPPATGSAETDSELPRWRASAFSAVDGARGVLFKGSLSPVAGASAPPATGIYGSALPGKGSNPGGMSPVFKVLEEGDSMAAIDPAAPAGSTITSLGMEREALRAGWLTLTVSSINAAGESWAGVYATFFPSTWHVLQPDPAVMGVLALGS